MAAPQYFCPKSIKCVVARVCRQNACGVALDPLTPNSRIQFDGFMELTLKPDIEKGIDISEKNANDAICVRYHGQDRLKGFEVNLKLCGVPLPVMEMLLDAPLLAHTPANNFVGGVLRNSLTSAEPNGKQIDFWSFNANRDQCLVAGVPGQVYVQWALVYTHAWEVASDFKFSNSALDVELKGYAEYNPNWIPSWPSSSFPSYFPGGGDPNGNPTYPAPTVLPPGQAADPWTLADQAAIRAGGPLAWIGVSTLPAGSNNCGYQGVDAGS